MFLGFLLMSKVCRDRLAVIVAKGGIMIDGLVTMDANKFKHCRLAQSHLLPFGH